ncbi:MAG TPA: thioredoxin [Gammaproteobacteria bacterium]|nr:thioredoxin [Gammaproteobacteria bacterium]
MAVFRTCPHCHRKNRVPEGHLADQGRCGACKERLPPLAAPLDASPEELRSIVAAAKVPVLVDFWAAWCGPCKMAAPEVERVAENMSGRAIVLKVDTERYPELAAELNVRSIPNFVVFKNGSPVLQQAGVVDHKQMQQWLRAAG